MAPKVCSYCSMDFPRRRITAEQVSYQRCWYRLFSSHHGSVTGGAQDATSQPCHGSAGDVTAGDTWYAAEGDAPGTVAKQERAGPDVTEIETLKAFTGAEHGREGWSGV